MRVAVVGSPPYAESLSSVKADIAEKLARAKEEGATDPRATWGWNKGSSGMSGDIYGTSSGQLGALPPGALDTPPSPTPPVPVTTWQGCYSDGWQDLIVPEAFCHPAKVSRGLSHRIYRHLLDSGYVRPGDTILDPFAGIGGFCLDAMTYGLRYIGVELERKFVDLAQQNLDLWRQRYGFIGGTVVQGDSRRLREVLAGAQVGCVVGSPPYHDRGEYHDPDFLVHDRRAKANGTASEFRLAGDLSSGKPYGTTPGQLGAMPPGAVVSSPPYSGSHVDGEDNPYAFSPRLGDTRNSAAHGKGGNYGTSPAQLGNTAGDTFWAASAQIMAELSALLPPGAVCAWVLKAYVSKKQIVPFPDQWRALCEQHGFQLVEEIHASLVEHHGTQEGLFDGPQDVTTEKKSFFRRLSEKKGSPRIDYETVLIMRKAGDVGGVCVVSSPPYAESLKGTETTIDVARVERLEAAGYTNRRDHGFLRSQHSRTQSGDYGTTPGNLGHMPVERR